MRCSSIPSSLILAATAALSFGACAADQTAPGGAGATPPASAPAAGSGTAAGGAGMTGAAAAAGKTGSTTSPATGAAGGGTSTTTASGSAGKTATASGGAAGATTAASGAAGTTTAAGGAAGASAGAAGGGAAAGGAVTFSKVHEEVLTGAGCASPACHGNASGPSKLGFADPDDAYMGLVGVMAMGTAMPGSMTMGCMGMPIMRVKAGDPAMSLLVQKLENKQTCGSSMPPGSMISADKIQLVKDWIMAGAKKD